MICSFSFSIVILIEPIKIWINVVSLFLFFSLILFSVLCFSSCNLFSFFFFYEALTISTFFLIILFGKNYEKIKASILFLSFSLLSSSLIYIYLWSILVNIAFINTINFELNMIFSTLLLIAFMIKLPIPPFHGWLPEAHAEATTGVSILLAAIILKVGGFGLLRFYVNIQPAALMFISIISAISILYIGLVCFKLNNIKQIIAYTSILHMTIAFLGIISNSSMGLIGGLFSLLQHSIVVTLGFILAGILKNTIGTYNIESSNGISVTSPIICFFLFNFILMNTSFPIFGIFLGEFSVLLGSGSRNILLFIPLLIVQLLCTIYFFNLYSKLCLTNSNLLLNYYSTFKYTLDIKLPDYFILLFLIFISLITYIFGTSIFLFLSFI